MEGKIWQEEQGKKKISHFHPHRKQNDQTEIGERL